MAARLPAHRVHARLALALNPNPSPNQVAARLPTHLVHARLALALALALTLARWLRGCLRTECMHDAQLLLDR